MRYDFGSTIDDSGSAAGHAPSRTLSVSSLGNRSGFSVIELMVVIAIIGILAAVGIPNAISWRNNAQFSGAIREVKSAIEGARMAAIKTNLQSNVVFNNTNAFTTQTQTILAGVPVAGTVVNHRMQPVVTINSNFAGNQLTFNNRGMPLGGIGGTVTIQHSNGLTRQIVVTTVGSSSIQ